MECRHLFGLLTEVYVSDIRDIRTKPPLERLLPLLPNRGEQMLDVYPLASISSHRDWEAIRILPSESDPGRQPHRERTHARLTDERRLDLA